MKVKTHINSHDDEIRDHHDDHPGTEPLFDIHSNGTREERWLSKLHGN